jgi:hypothetical protein
MVAIDEDALICDLWETYQVTDWRALPLQTAAVLAFGLSGDSRIKKAISKAPAYDLSDILLAVIADGVKLLAWMQTRDGQKGRNRPASITSKMTEVEKPKEFKTFETAEAFEAARARALGIKE